MARTRISATNPFTPCFGEVPPYMAGREKDVARMSHALESYSRCPEHTTLITGPRGTGKTAFLSRVSQLASSRGWICADVMAGPNMFDEVIECAAERALHIIGKPNTVQIDGVAFGPVSARWSFKDEEASRRIRLTRLLEKLQDYRCGLLVTVDEVRADIPELIEFVATYQLLTREGFRIALVMAGLPHNVDALLCDQDVSFLRRAQLLETGLISDEEVRMAFADTVQISKMKVSDEALDLAVAAIGGYPYMFQLIGFYAWENAKLTKDSEMAEGHLLNACGQAKRDMFRSVFEATFSELSEGDVRFLTSMLPDQGPTQMGDLVRRSGKSKVYMAQYRNRLLKAGIVGSKSRGMVHIELPFFKEYLFERLGLDPGDVDRAENIERFKALLDEVGESLAIEKQVMAR